MKRPAFLLSVAAFFVFPCFAQTPSAADLLAKYEQALGGRDAILQVTTRSAKGMLEIPDDNTSAPFELYQKAPGKYFLFINDPDNGQTREAVSGTSGWAQDSESGMHQMTEQELTLARRDHDFHREVHLSTLYPAMKVTGKERVGPQEAWVIEATAPDGATEKLYFDTTAGLLLERDFERVNIDSGIVMNRVVYSDYRKVKGILMPFTVRQSTPDDEFIFHYQDIQMNIPIEDSRFEQSSK